MDKLLETLNGYLKSASGLISAYAPAAWQQTLKLVHIVSIFHIVELLLITTITITLILWPMRKWFKWNMEDDWNSDGSTITFGVATFCLVGMSFWTLACWGDSIPDWLGVYDPALKIFYVLATKAGIL